MAASTSRLGNKFSLLGKSFRLGQAETGGTDIIQTLVFTQSYNLDLLSNTHITHNLTFAQTLHLSLLKSVSQSLVFTQNTRRVVIKAVNQSLSFSQTAAKSKIINENVHQNLNFNHVTNRANKLNFSIVQTLVFLPYFTRYIPFVQSIHSVTVLPATYTVIRQGKNTVILESDTQAIVLPAPEFDDGETNSDEIISRRSMTGGLYAYKKFTPFQKLSYTFQLGRIKSLELRQFFLINSTKTLALYNWKGEYWLVKCISNPITLIPKQRWGDECGLYRERIDVTLDFEGVRMI